MFEIEQLRYGYWAGASLHEVAQAVGAGYAASDEAGQAATIVKLTRVVMLAPLIVLVGAMLPDRHTTRKPPKPWFVMGFVACVVANSIVDIPVEIATELHTASSLMLTSALAALGFGARFASLGSKGLRPLALGAVGSLAMSAVAAVFMVAL